MGNTLFMSYDGDSAGRLVGQAVIADDVNALHEISARIVHGHEVVLKWVQDHGGQVISQGGDEGTFQVPEEAVQDIETLRGDYHFATNLTMTVGVGKSLSEAGKSLLVGKFKGKNVMVMFDPSVEVEILEAQNRASQGNASEEERKLSEAYLKPKDAPMEQNKGEMDDCEYCKEAPDDEDHCKYCHDINKEDQACQYCVEADAEAQDHEHTGDDCQYCQEAEASAQESHTHEDGSEADCQYCQEAAQQDQGAEGDPEQTPGPTVSDPTTQESQVPADPSMSEPFLEKPDINDGTAPGPSPVDTDMPSPSNMALDRQPSNQELAADSGNIFNQDEQSVEAMKEIVGSIDDGGEPAQSDMNAIDAGAAPVDGSMEDNVSRPGGYEENTPTDMGLAEDEVPEAGPDLSSVLKEGLDNHAESMQRDQIVQMVGQALDEFKGCKPILEKAKEQAPQLYSASINMLKAMIAMAEALGLADEQQEQQVNDIASDDQGIAQEQAQDPSMGAPKEQSPDGQDRPDNRPPAHFQHPSKNAPSKESAASPKPAAQQ